MAKLNSAAKAAKKNASKATRKTVNKTTSTATQNLADTLEEAVAKRRSGIEEAFSKGAQAGTAENAIYLSKDSSIFQSYLDKTVEQPTSINLDTAIQDAITEHKTSKGNTTSRTLGGSSPNSSNTSSSGGTRSGLSGNSPEPDAYSRRELKANRYNDKESYMRYVVGNQYDDAIKSWQNKDYNNPILTALKEEGVDLKNITKDDLLSKRAEKIKNASASDMGLGDWMGYTKLPQYATATGGTAWLVSKMSATKGQQSNSQLYGQSPY